MEMKKIWVVAVAVVLLLGAGLVIYNSSGITGKSVGVIEGTENCLERGDSGDDSSVYGEIIYKRGLFYRTSRDICYDGMLREFYCIDGQAGYKTYNCDCLDWKDTC